MKQNDAQAFGIMRATFDKKEYYEYSRGIQNSFLWTSENKAREHAPVPAAHEFRHGERANSNPINLIGLGDEDLESVKP